jgi:hypothetical protein
MTGCIDEWAIHRLVFLRLGIIQKLLSNPITFLIKGTEDDPPYCLYIRLEVAILI